MQIVPSTHKDFEIEYRGARRSITQVELTDAEHQKYMEARAALLWSARFFGIIFMDKATAIFTRDIPTLATDDRVILINPDYFLKLNVGERVFALCHEVGHMIYAHCQLGWEAMRRGYVQVNSGATQLFPDVPPGCLPHVPVLMNVAQDFMINAALVDCKVGTFKKDWLFNPKYTGTMSSIDIYHDLWQQQPQQKGKGKGKGKGEGEGSGGAGDGGEGEGEGEGNVRMPAGTQGTERFDEHLKPGAAQGKDPQQAAADRERDAGEWKLSVQKAAQAARMAGQLPAGLERLVNDVLQPQVDWRDKIIGVFARTLGGGGYDWQRADRDWINRRPRIYVPARSGRGCGTVVVVGDTSGSITQDEMRMVLGCVVGILEDARPQRVILLWCDAAVYYDGEYTEPGDLLARAKPKGGGGTNFCPPFDWCEENDVTPDTLVYVTDMHGRFPDRAPNYPVLWASISKVLEAPFGEVIEIPR